MTTPSDIAEEWVERAAIMEFDGGLARADAEARAWDLMRDKHGPEACTAAQEVQEMREELAL